MGSMGCNMASMGCNIWSKMLRKGAIWLRWGAKLLQVDSTTTIWPPRRGKMLQEAVKNVNMASMGCKNAARRPPKRQDSLDRVNKCFKKTETPTYMLQYVSGGWGGRHTFEIKDKTRYPKRHTNQFRNQNRNQISEKTYKTCWRMRTLFNTHDPHQDKPHMYMCGTTLVYIYIYIYIYIYLCMSVGLSANYKFAGPQAHGVSDPEHQSLFQVPGPLDQGYQNGILRRGLGGQESMGQPP